MLHKEVSVFLDYVVLFNKTRVDRPRWVSRTDWVRSWESLNGSQV